MTREFFLKESMIMLSVVIPTFNESKNIRNLVAQIDVALKGVDYEIVFVDDSKDNTPDVIMEALLVFGESAGSWISLSGLLYCQFSGGYRLGEK